MVDIVGLIGLIIASIVNIFIASTAMQFMMSVIGVIIFAGLTAYDTQVLKEIYIELTVLTVVFCLSRAERSGHWYQCAPITD